MLYIVGINGRSEMMINSNITITSNIQKHFQYEFVHVQQRIRIAFELGIVVANVQCTFAQNLLLKQIGFIKK